MTDSYEVGYGKPPKGSQFKKGQSGNPLGRPRAPSSIASLVYEMGNQVETLIKKNGKKYEITRRQALVDQLYLRAIQGDARAIAIIDKLEQRHLDSVNKEEDEEIEVTLVFDEEKTISYKDQPRPETR